MKEVLLTLPSPAKFLHLRRVWLLLKGLLHEHNLWGEVEEWEAGRIEEGQSGRGKQEGE